jgi:hypothetical protein
VDWFALIGYLAGILYFVSFCMKKMVMLRTVGMCANFCFVIYAVSQRNYPLLILHASLFPLNFMRLLQMLKLIGKVKEATKGDMSMEFLIPHMHKVNFKKGDVVFKKGERADKLYLLREGSARLTELDVTLSVGEIIGEIGILSGDHERMATLECVTDTEFLCVDDKQMLQLYYKNPEFGLYLAQLIIKRLKGDMELRVLSKPIMDSAE